VSERLIRWSWFAIGCAVVLLPLLPLPAWTGAPDPGPIWTPQVASWAIGVVVVVAVAAIAGRLALHAEAPALSRPRIGPWPAVLGLALLLATGSAAVMVDAFARNPHLVDEIAQLLQARTFVAGRFVAPPPEPPAFFLVMHTWITDSGWVAQYPPGQAMLLAIGLLVDAEWLVNPILGGIGAILIFVLGRGLWGPRTGLFAAVLWALAAWVLFSSATFMNHVGAVTFALGAWALVWGPQRATRWHWAGAGLLLAAVAATRPLDAVAAAIPVGAWIVARSRYHVVPWGIVGGVPVLMAWGYVNWRQFGDPFTLGYTALYGEAHGLGFHTDPWGEPYTPLVALSNMAVAIRRLHIYLYEWPIPALLPLALWAIVARPRRLADLIVALGIVSGPALYVLYWHSGYYLGPRFYYIAAPFLVLGAARACRWAWVRARQASRSVIRWDWAVVTAAVAVVLWGSVSLLPRRWEVYAEGLVSLKYHPERELAAMGERQALVLIPESWGSRIIVSLWALGAPPGLVERAYRGLDACDLHQFAEQARHRGMSPTAVGDGLVSMLQAAGEPPPVAEAWRDPSLRLRYRAQIPPDCVVELRRDLAGFTLYGNHAWRNPIGLDTGIVFARDLYERNPELLARYDGWPVWRYAPPPDDPEAPPVLTRIERAVHAGDPGETAPGAASPAR
jgi:hypothetical protein